MSERFYPIIDDLKKQSEEAARNVIIIGSGTAGRVDESVDRESGKADAASMDDKDVSRLEDRIEASNREAQLRLDAVMARIDGKFDTITLTISDIKTGLAENRTATRNWNLTLIIFVVGSAIALGSLIVGVKQVWISGVQVGQTISTSQPATSGH